MLLASDGINLIEPTPKTRAICPCCEGEVISKCGDVNVWHWAHKGGKDCDSWSEPETAWHKDWKERFPKECREVVVGNHRADILTTSLVIELQNSSITAKEIKEREEFYGDRMIWILNGEKFYKNLSYVATDETGLRSRFWFYWRYFKRSFYASKRPILVDLGKRLFPSEETIHLPEFRRLRPSITAKKKPSFSVSENSNSLEHFLLCIEAILKPKEDSKHPIYLYNLIEKKYENIRSPDLRHTGICSLVKVSSLLKKHGGITGEEQ